MSKQAFEHKLKQQLADLPREMQPDKDLWSGIDIALTTREHEQPQQKKIQNNVLAFKQQYVALAASILVVATLSWQLLTPAPQQFEPERLVNALTEQHIQQKSALLASYSETQAATANWQQQLDELEQAGEAIRAALKEDPDNVALMKMLQHTYQQQIDLIEKVHAPAWHRI
ncbi:MAG: hypothetical protein ACFHVJ_06375 [Aestuariibacter sp.]